MPGFPSLNAGPSRTLNSDLPNLAKDVLAVCGLDGRYFDEGWTFARTLVPRGAHACWVFGTDTM